MRRLVLVLLPLTGALLGCAARNAQPRVPQASARVIVAVLPAQWMTPDPSMRVDAKGAVTGGLESSGGVRVVEIGDDAQAEPEGCREDLGCLRRMGERAGADKLLVPRLAALGDTVLVRIGIVDVPQGTQEQTRQRVVQDATAPRVARAVRAIGAEVAEPFAPEPTEQPPAWFERWWVWAIAGGVVAGGAIAAGAVMAGDGGEQKPDAVITPP